MPRRSESVSWAAGRFRPLSSHLSPFKWLLWPSEAKKKRAFGARNTSDTLPMTSSSSQWPRLRLEPLTSSPPKCLQLVVAYGVLLR